jgi:integrase
MVVRKRGNIWYFDFMVRGRRYREAIPTARTKTQALAAEAEARRSVGIGKYAPAQPPRFSAFVQDVYLPWSEVNKRSYRGDVWRSAVLMETFGRLRLDEITVWQVEKFKRERLKGLTRLGKLRTPASVNRELDLLSRILSMAVAHDLLTDNVCRKVQRLREDNERQRVLSFDEEKRLLAVLERTRSPLRSMVVIALHTGMRRGEITSLTWSDVDFSRRVILVRQSKTGKSRLIPMNDEVRLELQKRGHLAPPTEKASQTRIEVCDSGYRIFEIDWIEKLWRRTCQKAGIVNLRFHDLRHTFATRLAEQGIDAFAIARLLGHSNVNMTARYAASTSEHLHEAVAKLSNLSQNCPKQLLNKRR